jgi:hypothetical protein
MSTPQTQVEIYNEVLGLLDAACAKLQPLIIDDDIPDMTRDYLMNIWRAIGNERKCVAEAARATQELIDCHCEGLEHEPDCPASPAPG